MTTKNSLLKCFVNYVFLLNMTLLGLLAPIVSSCQNDKRIHLTGNFPDLSGAMINCVPLNLHQPIQNGKLDIWLDDIESGEYSINISYTLKQPISIDYRSSDGTIKYLKNPRTLGAVSADIYLNPEQTHEYVLQLFKGATGEKLLNEKRYDEIRSNLFGLDVISNSEDSKIYKGIVQINKNYTYNLSRIMDSLYKHSTVPDKILTEFESEARKLNRQYNYAAMLKSKRDFAMKHLNSPMATLAILDVDSLNLAKNLYEYRQILDKMTGRAVDNAYYTNMRMKIETLNGVALNEGSLFSLPSGKTPTTAALTFKASDHKYTLVEFWASWCSPCRAQNPKWNTILDEYKKKGFAILGVSLDQFPIDWNAAIKEDKLTDWIHVSDLQSPWSSTNVIKYGIKVIPFNLLIDSQGRIKKKNIKPAELQKFLIDNDQ